MFRAMLFAKFRAVLFLPFAGCLLPSVALAVPEAPGSLPVPEGLVLWLRADQGARSGDGEGHDAQDGEPVREWQDQSGRGAAAGQLDPGRRPVFVAAALKGGLPVIRFTVDDGGQGQSLDGPPVIRGDSARTIFIVVRAVGPPRSFGSILELNRDAGAQDRELYQVTPQLAAGPPRTARFSRHPLDENFRILTIQNSAPADSGTIQAFVDAVEIAPSSRRDGPIDTGAGGYRLGDGNEIDASPFTGDVAEVVVYETLLDSAERNAVGQYLERKYALKTSFVPHDSPRVKVFLLGGQSNMVGQGIASELRPPLDAPQGDVMFWHNANSNNNHTNSGAGWIFLQRWRPSEFGPEMSFGRLVADAMPGERIALIKHAIGGTNLHVQWRPGDDGRHGPMYAGFLSTVGLACERLRQSGLEPQFEGMLWMQGESDARDGTMARRYEENFARFIQKVREEFGVIQEHSMGR